MGIEPFLISSSVIGVLAQRLVRTVCRNCIESYHPPIEALHRLGVSPKEGEDVVFYRGRGCDRCKSSGYRGRMALFELMPMTEAVRDLILRGASSAVIRTQAIQDGMRTLRDDGVLKVLEGATTVDELLRVVFVEG
jgi:type II secretory ATPase GspE/PulE/Tfp pilus assembly ATPase PilB-like protein